MIIVLNHLRFWNNPCNFRTLDCFIHHTSTWLAGYNCITLEADLLLCGERDEWRTTLKDVQS